MNSYRLLGFGIMVNVPFMPIMRTRLKMKQNNEQCARDTEGGSAVLFKQNEI